MAISPTVVHPGVPPTTAMTGWELGVDAGVLLGVSAMIGAAQSEVALGRQLDG